MEDGNQRKHSKFGQRVLNALISRKLATPEAVMALENLVDPFPDGVFEASGWPDACSTNSVRIVDNQEFSIGAPPGLAAGATWDLHVCNLPVPMQSFAGTGGTYVVSSSGGATITPAVRTAGLFSIVAAPSGSLPDVFSPALGTTSITQVSSAAVLQGLPYRPTCMGAELINTSSQLTKGGMGYAYRFPSQSEPVTYYIGPAPATSFLQRSYLTASPPIIPSDITNYPNTVKCTAENGIVFMNTPTTFENKPQRVGSSNIFWNRNNGNLGNGSGVNTLQYGPVCDWNIAGAFITGLANGASITVRIRVSYELFPTVEFPNMIALSQRPVPYSPELAEILNRILATLPAGFDYIENPFGEWFDRILDGIANIAPVVGSSLGMLYPPAALIGNAIGTGAKAIKGIKGATQAKMNEKKKQKVSQPKK